MVYCVLCLTWKDESEFRSVISKYRDYLPFCKECSDHHSTIWQWQNRKTIKGYLSMVWHAINYRCNNPKYRDYHRYGGRGIENRFESLDEFRDYVINDLDYDSYEKIKGLQIDRIDNNGHYEPGNIRFVTPKVNANNKG